MNEIFRTEALILFNLHIFVSYLLMVFGRQQNNK
jgi:hypothetical protein